MLIKIIILSLTVGLVINLTNLTSNNCPTDFNQTYYDSSQFNAYSPIYTNAFTPYAQMQIQKSFSNGDMQSLMSIIFSNSFLLPFILVAALFGLLFLCISCCCLFQRRCPPCQSWRRNYLKEPYSRCELTFGMIFAILFFFGILVTTIIVFSSFSLLQQDLKMVKCGLNYGLDMVVNGDQTSNWGGFGQIQNQIGNITSLLTSAASAVNFTVGNSWIINSFLSIQNMNLNLWNNNYQSTVLTPDPIATKNAINTNTAIPTVTPLFISKGLGPNGTVGAMVTDIDSSLKSTQKLAQQAQISYQSVQLMANSAASVKVNANLNLQSITMASNYLTTIQTSVQDFSLKYLDYSLTTGIYIMQAIFGVIVLACLIALLGVISTHVFDILRCGKFVIGGWVLIGFAFYGVLGILLVWLSIGGIGSSFCQYYESIIGSSQGLLNYSQNGSSSSFNKIFFYLDVCLFGDGNILKEFSLSQQIKTISDMFANIQTFLDMQTAGNTQYIDATEPTVKMLAWMTTMNQYGAGIYVDADNTVLTNSNPYIALANFNQRTQQSKGVGNSTCANDNWVFDATNCTFNSTQSLYVTSDTSNGLYIPPTGSLCISLNTRLSTSSPTIWSAKDIANRYLSLRSCKSNSTTAYNDILDYAQSLTNYRDTRVTLYQTLYNQLNAMMAFTTAYNNNLTLLSTQFNTFLSSVSSLNSLMTNQINGLTKSANCSAIGGGLRVFYNVFCVNFMQRSTKIVICCFVLLGLMVGAVLTGSLFAVRYGRVQKIRQFRGQNQQEMFSETKMEQPQYSVSSEEDEPDR